MCRFIMTTLYADPQASAAARRFLQRNLTDWQLPSEVTDEALLLASELMTNAVLHAKTASVLKVALTGQCLEVGVDDLSTAPVPRPAGGRRDESSSPPRRPIRCPREAAGCCLLRPWLTAGASSSCQLANRSGSVYSSRAAPSRPSRAPVTTRALMS